MQPIAGSKSPVLRRVSKYNGDTSQLPRMTAGAVVTSTRTSSASRGGSGSCCKIPLFSTLIPLRSLTSSFQISCSRRVSLSPPHLPDPPFDQSEPPRLERGSCPATPFFTPSRSPHSAILTLEHLNNNAEGWAVDLQLLSMQKQRNETEISRKHWQRTKRR